MSTTGEAACREETAASKRAGSWEEGLRVSAGGEQNLLRLEDSTGPSCHSAVGGPCGVSEGVLCAQLA